MACKVDKQKNVLVSRHQHEGCLADDLWLHDPGMQGAANADCFGFYVIVMKIIHNGTFGNRRSAVTACIPKKPDTRQGSGLSVR